MIPKRVHAPEKIVQAECYPAKRLVVTHIESGKHPAKLLPSKSSVARVVYQKFIIIPGHKLVARCGKEDCEGDDGNKESNPKV